MEKAAFEYIERIDKMGGAVEAIEKGFIQDEIANAAYEYQLRVESGEQVVVGVNRFVQEEEQSFPTFRVDDGIRVIQVDKLKALKELRSEERVQSALIELENAANKTENTMPYIIEAVESYATLGEIASIFRKVFGEYRG